MKPSFALDFRDGAIALLHRTSRGWQQVGATPIDAPDLGEALAYLRSTALGLSPRGVTTKLVIPNEQILYTQVHAPGPEVAKRKRQIKAALAGLTPYDVDDLVYDWWGNGSEVQVAIVPRETLAAAEAFATEHRFNPVSFVAAPDEGGFAGEPYFGPSALAASLLAEGEKVERDQDPIAVVAREYPRTEPVAEVAPEPEPVVAEVAVEPEVVVEPEPPAAVVEAPAEVAVAAPDPDPLPDFRAAKVPAAGVEAFDPKTMAIDLVDEAPMAVDVTDERKEPPVVPVADDMPDAPAGEMLAAFASRRQPQDLPPEPVVVAAEPAPPAPLPADFAAAKARKTPTVGAAPAQRPSVARPALARPAAALPSAQRDTVAFPGKIAAKFVPVKGAKGATAAAPPRGDRNVVQMPKAAAPAAATAGKGLTGLDGRPVTVRGKPRFLGLILTAILLVALALVAAWSSYYLSQNEADPNAAPVENAVADAAVPSTDAVAADEAVPTAEDEALADGQDILPADDPAAVVAATTPEPVPLPEPVPEVVKPEPAPATTIATDAAVATAPGNDPQDEIFLAAADVAPRTLDPVALAQVAANSDPPPGAAPPPPPFGTVYTFDAEGRIQPTPEGILTPEGVLLIAGPPKVVPPPRPAATVAVVAPVADAVVAAGPEPVFADPALAGKKPKPRPAAVVDAAATAEKQGEVLDPDLAPAADSRFASLRPQKRPSAMTAAAEVAEPEVPAAEVLAAGEASAASLAANGVQPSTSSLAVSVSKKPAARPSSASQAVDAAVAAAVRAPEPEPQAQVADAAPEAQAEPEVEAAAPRLPTNASVAKQATQKDALNLSRVALLGIFGTSSGRYAMIRQPGGGVKKVVVGDSIDGGRVAAISATAVQYKKGGRMVTLSLPTG